MLLYALVEVEDDFFEDYDEFVLRGDDLEIRYVDDAFRFYKAIPTDMLYLHPLPENDFIDEAEYSTTEMQYKAYVRGWNDCLEAIKEGAGGYYD